MKIILGTDSLQAPLTGIGRYTYELASGLLASESVTALRGFDLGRFHSIEKSLQNLESQQVFESAASDRGLSAIRRRLSNSVIATELYSHYVSLVSRPLLAKYRDWLFHSPNFHLPRASGPSVVTIHDLTWSRYPEYHPKARIHWMGKLVTQSVEASSHVICVSESTRKDLIEEHSLKEDRISVVYNGVDSSFRERSRSEVEETLASLGLDYGSYFLMVATLEPRKNIQRLLDAYLALDEQLRSRFPLVLAGGAGWHSDELQNCLRRAAGKGVIYLGYVQERLLPQLYSGAMCFVYPSLYEGFGLPVLEAQASGIPVITSNTSSLPEVASRRAILLDPLDVDSLRTAMQRAADDGQWRSECRAAGLIRASDFTWQRCVDSTIQIYRNIYRSNGGRGNPLED